MAREFVLALDAGTTGVRARAYAPEGRVVGHAHRVLPVSFPAPGRVEQDPERLHGESVAVLEAAMAEAGIAPAEVAALGIASQRATALAWDAETGRPLAPALGWQDQRRCQALDDLHARGIPIPAQAAAAKFLWWLEHSPEVGEAARAGRLRLGTPEAWLSDRLAGGAAHVTDPGHAGCTALYHAEERGWAEGLLALLGFEAAWLPEIVASAEPVAEGVGPLAGVPLAARAGDQQAAAFAAGLRMQGDAKLTLGTAAMLEVHAGSSPGTPSPGTIPLPLWRLPDGSEHHCLEGHVATAGSALEWGVALGLAPDVAGLDALARSAADSAGVVAVPAFQGLATPFDDGEARGFVGGITRGTGRAEFARALFEGVAHRCVDVAEAMGVTAAPLPADGGLSRSRFLLERIATLLGQPILRAADPEGTARGAAGLAALAVGLDPARFLAAGAPERIEPAPEDREGERARWRSIVTERVGTRSP